MSRAWTERLQYLSNLEDGWLDGYGKPSRAEATQAVENLLSALFPDDAEYGAKRPGIFPQEDGGITVEWYVANQLISVEVVGDEYDETYAFFEMSSDEKNGPNSTPTIWMMPSAGSKRQYFSPSPYESPTGDGCSSCNIMPSPVALGKIPLR